MALNFLDEAQINKLSTEVNEEFAMLCSMINKT
jgi:hypothetical protein